MGRDALMLLFAIGLAAILVLIRYIVIKGTRKASMAVRNKMAQREEAKNPPQRMNLADLYGGQAQHSANEGTGTPNPASADPPRVCPNCGRVLKPESKFCPVCGTKIEA